MVDNESYEIYLSLYQAVTGTEDERNIYKQFSPDFFDLIVVDECHRGSAADDSAWREILTYFASAAQIGLTATPKETEDVSNTDYFGEPLYTYSLKQGIEDGYLAPYKVVRVDLDRDTFGWRPTEGMRDKFGHLIEDRIYTGTDMNRKLVMEQRDAVVAGRITEYLKATDRFDKTIVFCDNIDHAERMRQALVNENADLAAQNSKYVMRITGDNEEGKAELDNFIFPESKYPVIATTSKLMTTGVDAQTCKLIVLDQRIQSMTEFKQIIGRGTRINEDYDKYYFTIIDFKKATELFADPDFDGDPVQIYEPKGDESPVPPDDGESPQTPDGFNYAPAEESPWSGVAEPRPGEEGSGIRRYVVANVEVKVASERVQYFDAAGRLITESLKDYTRKALAKEFSSLDDFLRRWNDTEKSRPSLMSWPTKACSLTRWPKKLAASPARNSTLSIWSAMWPGISRRSPAKSAPNRSRSVTTLPAMANRRSVYCRPCWINTPMKASVPLRKPRSSPLPLSPVSAPPWRSSAPSAGWIDTSVPFTNSNKRFTALRSCAPDKYHGIHLCPSAP